MNNEKITNADATGASNKPKKQRSTGRLTKEIYLLDEENDFNEPEFLGSLPEKSDERRHIRKVYGAGLYLIEEKQSGRFKGRYEIRIEDEPEAEPQPKVKFEMVDDDDFDDDEPQPVSSSDQAADVRVLLMQQENERLKNELRRQQTVSQSSQGDMMQMMLLMQDREDKAFQRGLAMLKLVQQQQPAQPAQPAQPTKDPLQMLSEIIAVNRGVRELSDELTPPARETSGGLLGDAAQLIDSLKGVAPMLLPMFLNSRPAQTPTAQTSTVKPAQNAATPNASLLDMFNQSTPPQEKANDEEFRNS